LLLDQLEVVALLLDKFTVLADFNDLSVPHHEDTVGVDDSR